MNTDTQRTCLLLKAGKQGKFLNTFKKPLKSGKSCSRTYWLKTTLLEENRKWDPFEKREKWWMLKDWKEHYFTRTHLLLRTSAGPGLSECGRDTRGNTKGPEGIFPSCQWLDMRRIEMLFLYLSKKVEQRMFELCLRRGALFDGKGKFCYYNWSTKKQF